MLRKLPASWWQLRRHLPSIFRPELALSFPRSTRCALSFAIDQKHTCMNHLWNVAGSCKLLQQTTPSCSPGPLPVWATTTPSRDDEREHCQVESSITSWRRDFDYIFRLSNYVFDKMSSYVFNNTIEYVVQLSLWFHSQAEFYCHEW